MKNNSQNTESLSFIQEREVRSIGYLYEVFVVDTSDGYCYSCEIEDELAVTVYAYNIAFVTTKGSGEDTQLDMVTGKLLERLTQEEYGIMAQITLKGQTNNTNKTKKQKRAKRRIALC